MQKLGGGVPVLIIVIVFNFAPCWAQETLGPKMVLKENAFDFKQVKQGEVIEHAFKVLNKGDQPLEIKVRPG
ncbi:MAG: hypothetical protein SV375_12050 [Thermodesulfobacteriota bacterium]|nr:hypothetical protein [Thermodesulfobacteriota bacterium]